MTPRRRSITTLAKTTKFPSNTHHCTRRRLVDHPLSSHIHIRNTFIYHIFNVSPGARNSGWVGGAWFGFGLGLGRGRLFIKFPEFFDIGVSGHHILHKTGHNLFINCSLSGGGHLLRSSTLLSRLGVQLGKGDVVLHLRLDGATELLDSLLLSVDTILLGNLHHLILLVETALLTTNLKITSLVYRNVHCLVLVENIIGLYEKEDGCPNLLCISSLTSHEETQMEKNQSQCQLDLI